MNSYLLHVTLEEGLSPTRIVSDTEWKKREKENLVHDTVSGFIQQQEFSKLRDPSTEKLIQSQLQRHLYST